jgi:hypothetical protein
MVTHVRKGLLGKGVKLEKGLNVMRCFIYDAPASVEQVKNFPPQGENGKNYKLLHCYA